MQNQDEIEKQRKCEEEERRKRRQHMKRKRRILEASFEGDCEEILNILNEVLNILITPICLFYIYCK